MSDLQLVIYAKNPLPGKVKTRLAQGSNRRFASQAYLALLRHTVNQLAQQDNVVLAASPNTRHGSIRCLCKQHRITLKPQARGNLGQRMAKTIRQGLKQHAAVAIVGTDCPSITRHTLKIVKQQLAGSNTHCVIPANDGGYVLIASKQYEPVLFQSIAWSTAKVMRQTQRQARRLGHHLPATPAMTDIDHIQAWRQARRRGEIGPIWNKRQSA
jgi:rSAM/selenodomain-associated transferase 1